MLFLSTPAFRKVKFGQFSFGANFGTNFNTLAVFHQGNCWYLLREGVNSEFELLSNFLITSDVD